MARIVKIAWPAVGKPYRGFITKFRQCLDEVYDAVNHSPKEKPVIRSQFEAFATAAGLPAAALPGNQRIFASGQQIPLTGTNVTPGAVVTLTIAGGILTAAVVTGQEAA